MPRNFDKRYGISLNTLRIITYVILTCMPRLPMPSPSSLRCRELPNRSRVPDRLVIKATLQRHKTKLHTILFIGSLRGAILVLGCGGRALACTMLGSLNGLVFFHELLSNPEFFYIVHLTRIIFFALLDFLSICFYKAWQCPTGVQMTKICFGYDLFSRRLM